MTKQTTRAGQAAFPLTLLAAASLMAHGLAFAQTPPNTGTILQQLPAQPPVQRAPAPLPAIKGPAIEPPMQALANGGRQIDVQKFVIVGNREIDSASLQALVATEGGKAMSLADIEAVATRLTRYYRAKGYFVARVYVPQQEIKDGVVTLRAVEGNYGRFILQNNSLVRDSVVQGMLDDVKRYDIVSLNTLERAMLIINDTPGSRITRADVMPGEVVGTSDFAVEASPDPRLQGYVMGDNHGSRYTGKERLSFNVDWISPTRSGDRLSVSGLSSVNGNLVNGRLAYSAPLSYSGWRGEVALSQTNYELGNVFQALDAQGRARGIDVGVTYPLKRTEAQTIEAGLSYAYKDLKDEIRATDTVTPKNSNVLTASLNIRDDRRVLGVDGLTQAGVSLSAGQLDIRSSSALQLDQAAGGPEIDGGFGKFNLNLSRLNLLPLNFSLTGTFKLQAALGNKNLDGSERLGVSGVGGVMAYPSGELSGSDGTLIRLELARPLPNLGNLQSQWSVFADYANARALKAEPYRTLRDVGVGWSASYKGAIVKAYWAYRADSQPAQSEKTNRAPFLIQAGWIF